MQRRVVRLVMMMLGATVAASVNAQTGDWGNIAVISDTLGNHAGRICIGEGLRISDIGCPTYAPSVTTAGDVSVSGNLSANKFIGDGSLLTGIGQGDRIVSGTLAITANSATSYVSLSTDGTDWGYLSSGNAYLPNLRSNNISSSGVIQVSGSTITCAAGTKGAIRYSNTSSTIEYCNSTAWTSLGPSETVVTGVGASITGQTVATASWTAASFDTELFDTNGMYSAGQPTRFTVPAGRAGYYMLSGWASYPANATGGRWIRFNKNGSGLALSTFNVPGSSTLGGNGGVGGSYITYLAAGDYVELNLYQNSGGNLSVDARFTAVILTPQGGGSGGATTLDELTDVNTAGATAGSVIRYDGANWVVSTTGASVSAMASLTDVVLTNIAGRDYLRYDAGTSKWVNISESTVMSTTTMVPNWPDAIQCSNGATSRYLYLRSKNATNVVYSDLVDANADRYTITYLASTGAYDSHSNNAAYDCVTNAWSISQIYAQGRGFNFIGNAASSGGSALGDRITSGTHAVTVNTSSGYISLSTNGTDWGYFGNGSSFLPTIYSNRIGVGTTAANATLQVSGTFTVSTSVQGSTSPSLFVASNGAVGIGTTAPSFPLQINTTNSNTAISIVGGSGGINDSVFLVANGRARFGYDGVRAATVITDKNAAGSTSNKPIAFDTVGVERMRIGLTGNIGISTTTPSAKLDVVGTISASDAIQVGNSSITCDSGTKGAMRYSNTSNTLEYCNSTVWTSVGPSTSVPSFRVIKSGTQSIASGANVAVTWDTTTFDTNANFDLSTERYTPTIPGTYIFNASLPANAYGACSTSSGIVVHIRKNGTIIGIMTFLGNGTYQGGAPNLTTIAQANGTTDNFEVYINNTCAGAYVISTNASFSGALIAGGGSGGGGGSADNLGDHTATQNLSMGAYNVVGTGQVSVTDISVTHLQLKSPATLACNSGALGTIRFNPTTGAPQICVQR